MSRRKKDYFQTCIEIAKKHNKCSNCGNELTTVINGEIWGDKAKYLLQQIKEYDLKIETFGIIYRR